MENLNYILSYLPSELSFAFSRIDTDIKSKITEIRIRRDKPVVVVIRNYSYFIDANGDLFDCFCRGVMICDSEVFDKLFLNLCDYTLYANMQTLNQGYLMLPNGARIGVCSTANIEDKIVKSVKNISSLNIRISREHKGCAYPILNAIYQNDIPNVIIAGKPNSGKTTLLRDIARGLSSGFNNKYRKVSIIDERNEIAGKCDDLISLDIGVNTDILTGFSKAKGIEIATRTLSPEIIICDEISTDEELENILFAFSSGVKFALSVHVGSKSDLFNKSIVRKLLANDEFDYIVYLNEYTYKAEIIKCSEVQNEINRCSVNNVLLDYNRHTIM